MGEKHKKKKRYERPKLKKEFFEPEMKKRGKFDEIITSCSCNGDGGMCSSDCGV